MKKQIGKSNKTQALHIEVETCDIPVASTPWGGRCWTHWRSKEQGLACNCDTHAQSQLAAFIEQSCNMLCYSTTVQLTEACESCDVTMWPFFVVPRSFSVYMLELQCQISILASLMHEKHLVFFLLHSWFSFLCTIGPTSFRPSWISFLLNWGLTGPPEQRHEECLWYQLWRAGWNLKGFKKTRRNIRNAKTTNLNATTLQISQVDKEGNPVGWCLKTFKWSWIQRCWRDPNTHAAHVLFKASFFEWFHHVSSSYWSHLLAVLCLLGIIVGWEAFLFRAILSPWCCGCCEYQ